MHAYILTSFTDHGPNSTYQDNWGVFTDLDDAFNLARRAGKQYPRRWYVEEWFGAVKLNDIPVPMEG